MTFSGGYIFKSFEGAAEPVLRDFPIPETISHDYQPLPGHLRVPWRLERKEALELFHSSGCAALFPGRFETLEDCDRIQNIIIGAVHNSLLNQAWKPEIFEDRGLFIDGLKTLHILFPSSRIIIAINKRNRSWFETAEVRELAAVRIMSDRYPQEFPAILRRDLLKAPVEKEDEATLVIPFLDVLQTSESMTRGRPLIDRIILVAGPGVSRPGWYRIRIGVRFEDIRKHLLKSEEYGPWRIIRGDALTGVVPQSDSVQISDREITVIREHAVRDFYRFLNPGFTYDSYSRLTFRNYLPLLPKRMDSSIHGGVRPCVQCNFCDEVCPVKIYPHLIWKHVKAGMIEQSFRLKPQLCIDCRLCDYVCPSKISLSSSVQDAVKKRREGGAQ
ncbi:MAG: 4Fe-4S dicluster domain-containing protein [Candidatus Latescibacter sp.]|nr:4Fe-4S dicluster domain-containing protein [Candidatus Latescibacter sp.]